MLKLLPEWLKLGAAAVLAVALSAAPIHFNGKREGRNEERAAAEIKAAKEALKRIDTLEKNNASFRNLDPHHRCLVFARDSRLPDTICNDD